MISDPIIKVSDLAKAFRVSKRHQGFLGGLKTLFATQYEEVKAVDGITFEIARGELVGYLGPNGAGKSTTIKMLTGVLYPTGGEAIVDGIVPYRERKKNSRHIGVIFGQRGQLVWDLPPRDTYELIRRMYSIPATSYRTNLSQFTELLGLADLLDKPVRQLSLGQRMRCELVASLLHDPRIIYLDEPTIGLDIVAKERIREFILRLNREQDTTVLLTTHDLSDIEKICKRVMIIDKGKIIYDGNLSEIKERYGRLRRLIFVPLDGTQLDRLEEEVHSIDKDTTVDLRGDKTVAVSFDPHKVPAQEITKHIVNNYEVKDLSLEEADIEVIVSEIYQKGRVG
jgi:ABC-2 type transport system ATP-binding protein